MVKANYVDPTIGTVGDEQQNSIHGGGKTHPGAVFPGGMVQLSPDTVTAGDNGTGYNYCHNTIEGFSFNHMSGIGWYGDLGNLQVMPVVGQTDLRSGSNAEVPFKSGGEGWKSAFSHEKEIARAGYYSVFLERYGVLAEATATCHTGLLRFTFPEGSDAGVILNFSRRIAGRADFQHVEMPDERHIEGFIRCTPRGGGFGRGAGNIAYTFYFHLELSEAPVSRRFFANEQYCIEEASVFEGADVGLLLRFDPKTARPLVIRCGISYTDAQGARGNLAAEYAEFDEAVRMAEESWESALACVAVEGENETDLTLFYTCLYHALLDPRMMADADGRFRTADGRVLRVDYTRRTVFSGWDVYRSEFPLLTLIRPDVVNDTVCSLLDIALENNSAFPRWELMGIDSGCMVGDPGAIVFADAYVKGIREYDVKKAFEIAMASCRAQKEFEGRPFASMRPDTAEYLRNAYVANKLSDTLELLLADYAMYRVAEAAGNADDAAYLRQRICRYRENFDPRTGFLGPRDENGTFVPLRDEYDTFGCVESNIFQQSWFVPFDVEGLAELFGRQRALQLLERMFERADLSALWNEDYNHSNEPCHNLTHYFNLLGQPKRTQYWTRAVQKKAYRLGAFGFCGNEDVGQLSAWYVLSALGFAQICPADPKFYLNTPLFRKAEIALSPGYHACTVSDRFVINCDKDPLKFPYIGEIFLNGERIGRNYLTYKEITAGGRLELTLVKE